MQKIELETTKECYAAFGLMPEKTPPLGIHQWRPHADTDRLLNIAFIKFEAIRYAYTQAVVAVEEVRKRLANPPGDARTFLLRYAAKDIGNQIQSVDQQISQIEAVLSREIDFRCRAAVQDSDSDRTTAGLYDNGRSDLQTILHRLRGAKAACRIFLNKALDSMAGAQ
jgi:hypothetical protein